MLFQTFNDAKHTDSGMIHKTETNLFTHLHMTKIWLYMFQIQLFSADWWTFKTFP